MQKIEALIKEKGKVCIAIDGGAGSGKTTLADFLCKHYGAEVIHMDDFFLRPEQRTKDRLAEAGGNFDRERFVEEVLPHLVRKEPFSYQCFDCSVMALGKYREVAMGALTVVEGSYSHHPALAAAYDLRVFLHVDEDTQRARIIERNGKRAEMFFSRWIPMEKRYFETFLIEEMADLVIEG